MRAGQGRGAATDGMVRSAPVVSCQAVFTGLAAAPEEPPRQVGLAVGQAVPQRGRFQRGHRHALPVDRVERADRIAGDYQPGREPAQPVVPPPQVGREPVRADVVERAGGGDRGEHVQRGNAAREGQESVRVRRRVMTGIPGQGQDPAVVFLGEQGQGGRPGGLGADQDQLGLAQRAGGQPQVTAGVLDVDPDLLLGRRVVAHLRQPRWSPPAAAGRISDQVGCYFFFPAAGRPHPDAGDPVPGRRGDQPGHRAPVRDRDVVQGPDPAADLAFEIWPAGQVARVAAVTVQAQQMTPDREQQLPGTGEHRHPSDRQVGQQSREQLLQDLRAARQQHVRMPALRNPLPVCRALRQQVAVDNRHPLVGIRQHPGRQQPAHAGPKDHSVITDLPHHG